MHKSDEVAAKLFGVSYEALDDVAKKVARHISERTHIARNVSKEFDAEPDFGQRAADAVASFGGSWTFVGLFAATMLLWMALNTVLLARGGSTFDPYPYILLNLFLSMLAAIQAPRTANVIECGGCAWPDPHAVRAAGLCVTRFFAIAWPYGFCGVPGFPGRRMPESSQARAIRGREERSIRFRHA